MIIFQIFLSGIFSRVCEYLSCIMILIFTGLTDFFILDL